LTEIDREDAGRRALMGDRGEKEKKRGKREKGGIK